MQEAITHMTVTLDIVSCLLYKQNATLILFPLLLVTRQSVNSVVWSGTFSTNV